MGANTYRLMSGFATEPPDGSRAEEADSLAELTNSVQGRVLLDIGGPAVMGQHASW